MKSILERSMIIGTLLLITGCGISSVDAETEKWKPQEIAIMMMTRCLVSGGHFSRNDASKFIAQVNEEQGGQYQRVYDSIYTGVSRETNQQVENLIETNGGCRSTLTEFVYSEPKTPFKESIKTDWILEPIEYPDDK